jgi:hypothetical protein
VLLFNVHACYVLQLLLGYLPPDPSEWDEVLARKRTQYLLFCEVRVLSFWRVDVIPATEFRKNIYKKDIAQASCSWLLQR